MNWSLGGIRIFVTDGTEEVGQIVAKLQPLSGGTIHQIFGYETPVRKLSCYIVGEDNKELLMNLTTSGTTFELQSPEGVLGDFIVEKVSMPRVQCVKQTIDLTGSLTCDSPVFRGDITLLED